jgi:hypothetical protein
VITEAVRELRRHLDLPLDPTRRGPVPLNLFFENIVAPRVAHFARPDMTSRAVVEHLRAQGVPVFGVEESDEPLVGFLFRSGNAAWAYVCNDEKNPIGRQRFTAAHELGHAVLHRDRMKGYIADATISETDDATGDMEREANRFAAELLMPEEVIRERAEELMMEHKACPRLVLAYRLASELLVSREAVRYRLKNMGVGDDD